MAELLFGLLSKVSIIIVIAYLFSNTHLFNKTINSENYKLKDKLLISIFFGAIGILGTYSGIPYMGAIVNNRVIGVAIGGLIGGPMVGFLAGTIAGGHRFLIDIGGFTATSCAISTVIEGLIAGFLSGYFNRTKNKIPFAFLTGLLIESVQMVIILLIARPFKDAILLVEKIAIPMLLVNAIGIAIIVAIVQNIRRQNDAQAAFRAQMALKIANQTLPYFSKGLTVESAQAAAKIIHEIAGVDAIAITDKTCVLAHFGIGIDHHLTGEPFKTKRTKYVLTNGVYEIAHDREAVGCSNPNCTLTSAIIAPLKIKSKTMGTLKLYHTKHAEIKKVDLELVLGLASLFSTQLELSEIEEQSKRLTQSELKALQAQINPHFLFNALNTINALIRMDPDDARRQLTNLADYFRHNLRIMEDRVTLGKELVQIQSYLELEKARYREKLDVTYEINANLSLKIPPLIVQPLVENSIKHGIFHMKECGKIRIVLNECAHTLAIEVHDDGIGMSPARIHQVLSGTYSTESIGLLNTHKRLQNIYGRQNGLRIESDVDLGTTVRIHIPLEGGT